MPVHFTPDALKFLRSLRRNNRREWFNPRKPIYEVELRTPMLALIAEINKSLAAFAPQHVRPPEKTILRIYRDTRFSANKLPYKSHISAWWAHTAMPKTSAAGFYLHIAPDELLIAAGVYMPQRDQLLGIRRYLLDHHADLERLLARKPLRKALPDLDTTPLTRPPKGFPADHPGIALIRCTQWALSVSLPAETALQPTLLREVVHRFKLAAPLVHLLNTPLLSALSTDDSVPVMRRPLFPLS